MDEKQRRGSASFTSSSQPCIFVFTSFVIWLLSSLFLFLNFTIIIFFGVVVILFVFIFWGVGDESFVSFFWTVLTHRYDMMSFIEDIVQTRKAFGSYSQRRVENIWLYQPTLISYAFNMLIIIHNEEFEYKIGSTLLIQWWIISVLSYYWTYSYPSCKPQSVFSCAGVKFSIIQVSHFSWTYILSHLLSSWIYFLHSWTDSFFAATGINFSTNLEKEIWIGNRQISRISPNHRFD